MLKQTATPLKDMEQLYKQLMAAFVPEDRVLIAITADPDAMASAMAMKRLLWRKVAQVTIAHHNTIYRPDNLAMIRLLKIPMVTFKQIKTDHFSKVVLVDSQQHHSKEFANLKVNVVVDHHPPGPQGPHMMFNDIRAGYGANSTIMVEYLKQAGIRPSERLATALSYGIRTDTAMFIRANLEQDVKAFVNLYPYANAGLLRNIQSSEMRLKDLKFLQEGLSRYTMKRNCVYLHLNPSPNSDTLVQLADFFLKVDSVDMTVVSGVLDEKLIIIMRYLGNVGARGNVGKMAAQAFAELGTAGGHTTVARAELPVSHLARILPDTRPETLALFIQKSIAPPRMGRPKKVAPRLSCGEPVLQPGKKDVAPAPPPPPITQGTGGPQLAPNKKP